LGLHERALRMWCRRERHRKGRMCRQEAVEVEGFQRCVVRVRCTGVERGNSGRKRCALTDGKLLSRAEGYSRGRYFVS
jgi:hypothetical protein